MNTAAATELGTPVGVGPQHLPPGLLPGAVVQLFLFQGDRYLGWDCFAKDMVLVGGEPGDDLTLDGLNGSGNRLVVYVDGKRIVVHDPSGSGAVRVNDEPITTRVLGALDVVTVGCYSLKARLEQVGSGELRVEEPEAKLGDRPEAAPSTENRHEPELIVAPEPETDSSSVDQEVADLFEPQSDGVTLDETTVEELQQGLDAPHALDTFQVLLEQATVSANEAPTAVPAWVEFDISSVETEPSPETVTDPPAAPEVVMAEAPVAAPAAAEPAPVTVTEEVSPEPARHAATWAMPSPMFVPDDEPDEDGEEDREARFELLDLALWNPNPDSREELDGMLLQVARTRGGQLLDLALLDHDQRYRHPADGRRASPLARRDRTGRSYLTLSRARCAGELLLDDGQRVPLDDLLTSETRVSRRKDRYRVELPRGAQARLKVGGEQLVIHEVPRRQSPSIQADTPTKKSGVVRNLASSSLVHVLVLMVGSLFLSLPSPEEPPPPETRFVQLDVANLKPAAPKPEPKPAVAPVKVAKVAKAKPKPASAPKKKISKKAEPGANPALASTKGKGPTSAAASPKAGGGHGGNARNRNIKKVGILATLGIPNGINLGASQAMAAVTNIDAVPSPRSSEAALKVGGIVGSLGSGRVEMPAVGLVNTKGSTQVVVSAGIGGNGTVAALERGVTGETQVRAMVTADIKVPASVSGGMSREEVKRVIDEHMDEVSYCYETALIEDPGLMGRMAFEWKILLSGRVGEVSIQSSSIQSDPLHTCIKRAIRTWRFPEPRGAEVLVSYPFVFDVVGF